jgi:hypothetical protein
MNQVLKISTFNLLTNSNFSSCEELLNFLCDNGIWVSFDKFETIRSENDIENNFKKDVRNIIYYYYKFDLSPNYACVEIIKITSEQFEKITRLIKLKEFL